MKKESTKRADATREVVLQKGVELFLKHGYKNTTMKDLAKAVGIKAPGVYYYFKSKQDILSQTEENGWKEFREKVYDEVKAISDPEEAIKLYIRKMIKYQIGKKHQTLMTVHDSFLPKRFQKMSKQRDRKVFVFLREKLREVAAHKGRKHVDCTLAAFALVSMVLNIYRWYKPKKRMNLEQLQEQTIQLFFSGFHG